MKRLLLVLSTIVILLCLSVVPAFAENEKGLTALPDPIDPQDWKIHRDMTWDEYKPNPVVDWSTFDISKTKTRDLKGLMILVDYPDRPFIVTEPKNSELFGNPVIEPVAREDLAQFWVDYHNKPSELNHYQSIHNHWAEITFGKWNVTLDAVGPYTMPGYEFQYGMSYGTTTNASNPLGDRPPGLARRNDFNDAVAAAQAAGVDFGPYDFAFVLHAGYTESGVWQEFGEMIFEKKEDVTAEWGALAWLRDRIGLDKLPQETVDWALARDAAGKNWARSRYGNDPWTAWYTEVGIWSHAGSTSAIPGKPGFRLSSQAENDGMGTFSHEFGHILNLTDNYNDQYIVPEERSFAGMWDIMSGGNHSGPGGQHTRWMIPSQGGAAVPPLMSIRTKIRSGFLGTSDIVDIDIEDLRNGTPVVAEILARNIPIGEAFGIEGKTGLRINNMVEQKPRILYTDQWDSDTRQGNQWYNGYTMEVVDRAGYDSFVHGHGVLISKYRDAEVKVNTWVIDAHPEASSIINFYKPGSGEAVTFGKGHSYQLADAAFHAGISSVDTGYYNYGTDEVVGGDTVNEFVDEWNGLHFYILDKNTTPGPNGDLLSYKVAVRAMNATLGTTPPQGGVAVGGELVVEPGELISAVPGLIAQQDFTITNTGDKTDIVRINVSDIDFPVTILNNLFAIEPGETITVPVYVEIPFETDVDNMLGQSLIFTASSETNATKVGTVAISTLDLVLGGKANLRLVTDANLVKSGDYFRANAYFREAIDSNTATVEFIFDKTKFLYRGFTPAEGVEVLNRVDTPDGVKFTFMKRDYATKSFGEALFSAKEDIDMAKEVNELKVRVDYVTRVDGEKVVKSEIASTCFTTILKDPPVDPTLVALSNLIDVFGMKNTHPDWNIYRYYDYNNNRMIDIFDVSKLASMLK